MAFPGIVFLVLKPILCDTYCTASSFLLISINVGYLFYTFTFHLSLSLYLNYVGGGFCSQHIVWTCRLN